MLYQQFNWFMQLHSAFLSFKELAQALVSKPTCISASRWMRMNCYMLASKTSVSTSSLKLDIDCEQMIIVILAQWALKLQ